MPYKFRWRMSDAECSEAESSEQFQQLIVISGRRVVQFERIFLFLGVNVMEVIVSKILLSFLFHIIIYSLPIRVILSMSANSLLKKKI